MQRPLGKRPDWAEPHVHLRRHGIGREGFPTAISEFELALSSNAKGLKSQEINRVQERLEIARQRLSE